MYQGRYFFKLATCQPATMLECSVHCYKTVQCKTKYLKDNTSALAQNYWYFVDNNEGNEIMAAPTPVFCLGLCCLWLFCHVVSGLSVLGCETHQKLYHGSWLSGGVFDALVLSYFLYRRRHVNCGLCYCRQRRHDL